MSAQPWLKPILRYPGGKARIAPWIASLLPPHDVYIEPFCGAASVLFAKAPVQVEMINDVDGNVVNLFRVLRDSPEQLERAVALTPYAFEEFKGSEESTDDPIEAARRYLVRVWFAHGGKTGSWSGWRQGWAGGPSAQRGSSARVWSRLPDRFAPVVERLRGVMIDHRPAADVIAKWSIPEALIFADPPYLMRTRTEARQGKGPNAMTRYYEHEMTDADHVALLEQLGCHPGPVVLCGYRSDLYDAALRGWVRVDKATRAYRGAERTESLWLNPVAAAAARQPLLMEVDR